MIYGEFLSRFRLKNDDQDILVPRFIVLTLGEHEEGLGTDGLQILEYRLFMDTGILGRYVTEKNKREARKRRVEVVDYEVEEVTSPSEL